MSYRTATICTSCSTQPSVLLCEGCQRKFCRPCWDKHGDELTLELEELCNRRNELMEMLNKYLPNEASDACSCFEEINRWENEMYAQINRVASEARTNVRQIVSKEGQNARDELERISQDIQQRQKTKGYVEGDLDRIKQQLTQLTLTIQRFNEQIRVDTSNSKNINWNSLLFIAANRNKQINATPTIVVPSSPNPYSSFNRGSNNTMPISRQHPYAYTSQLPNTQRPTGRSASVSAGYPSTTYTCIGCKSTNIFNQYADNFCSVCRSPARL